MNNLTLDQRKAICAARELGYGEDTILAIMSGKANANTTARENGIRKDAKANTKRYLDNHKYRTEMRRQFPKFA